MINIVLNIGSTQNLLLELILQLEQLQVPLVVRIRVCASRPKYWTPHFIPVWENVWVYWAVIVEVIMLILGVQRNIRDDLAPLLPVTLGVYLCVGGSAFLLQFPLSALGAASVRKVAMAVLNAFSASTVVEAPTSASTLDAKVDVVCASSSYPLE